MTGGLISVGSIPGSQMMYYLGVYQYIAEEEELIGYKLEVKMVRQK